MFDTNTMVKAAESAKPLLKKMIPLPLLQKGKNRIIANHLRKLSKERMPYKSGYYPLGVNLIGDIESEAGLGQSCRLTAAVLEQTGVPLNIFQYSVLGNDAGKDDSWKYKLSDALKYDINLIHINPLELGTAYCQMERSAWDYRYNIAFWLWELEEFPDKWTPYFSCLDEIWAPSEFICDAIKKKTKLPVKCMPYYVPVPVCTKCERKDFGLPDDKFLFLMMYDSHSCTERKNPFAVMQAFKKAFAKEDRRVGLVIKIGHCMQQDREKINSMMEGYTNIYLLQDRLERGMVNSLIQCVDVVVSLHRAEGFGLVLAEAMLLGTPVIATNWSANTEFMNPQIACMVDYQFCTIEKGLPPFPAGCRWADPDIGQAADYMKKLCDDQMYYEKLSIKAKEYVEQRLGMERALGCMRTRLEEIRSALEENHVHY